MYIKEVLTATDRRLFHQFQRDLYRGDDRFVAPLEFQVENIFTPSKNEFFKHGSATRFLLFDDQDRVIGRVAAFINENKAFTFQQPTGGMGFFECIEDRTAAFRLMDQARAWLAERGMEAMDGPINFGENDNFWGLLVEGFEESCWGMPYNPPYYKQFFEEYGFKLYFEQVTNMLDLRKPFPERFWKVADWARSKPDFSYKHVTFKDIDKFMQDFKEVYDDAWQFHENFTPIDPRTLAKELKEGRGVVDPKMIWFAYHQDEPIAFLVMFPDAGQIFKHFDGKMNWLNRLRFLCMKRRHMMTRTRITIMGIKPKYQRYGIESAIFYYLNEVMKTKPWYTHIELSWVGDFNPKMRALHESVGATFYQRHYTYRCLFDQTKDFERSSVIAKDTKQKYMQALAEKEAAAHTDDR